MPDIPISPEVLARARAVVLDPGSVDCHPAMLASAWDILKTARGQIVDHSVLTPAHLVGAPRRPGPTPPETESDIMTRTYVRTVQTIRATIAGRYPRSEGGAA